MGCTRLGGIFFITRPFPETASHEPAVFDPKVTAPKTPRRPERLVKLGIMAVGISASNLALTSN
jgi:hypothetical protein